MSHADFGRGDTGIYTVEGNLAGGKVRVVMCLDLCLPFVCVCV